MVVLVGVVVCDVCGVGGGGWFVADEDLGDFEGGGSIVGTGGCGGAVGYRGRGVGVSRRGVSYDVVVVFWAPGGREEL